MKCPKCGIDLTERTDVCPFCKTPLSLDGSDKANGDTQIFSEGRFSNLDPNKESYDFDLQYTLTFKDANEIKKAIADLDLEKDTADALQQEANAAVTPPAPSADQEEDPEIAAYRRAAERAARRREERRSNGGRSRKASARDTERRSAPRSDAAEGRQRRIVVRKPRRILIGSAAAIVVIALIIGSISIIAGLMNGAADIPTVYLKDNALFLSDGGTPVQLSDALILAGSEAPAASPSPSAAPAEEDEDETDENAQQTQEQEQNVEDAITEEDLVQISSDGKHVYYFSNFDLTNHCGDLYYIADGNANTQVKIASDVYYKIELSNAGDSVMFLSGATPNGAEGQLNYWNANDETLEVLESSVTDGLYCFSGDGKSVFYVTAYNAEYYVGNLFVKQVGKKAGESIMLDTDVALLFGSNADGTVGIYAKNYQRDTGAFDVYSIKTAEEIPTLIAGGAKRAPVLLERSNSLYAYESEKDGFHNLLSVNLETNAKKKLADEITEVTNISQDEGAVVYAKRYDNNGTQIIDYYYVSAEAANPQKIANNVGVFVDDQHAQIVQFSVSDDLTKVAYIAGFDTNQERGTLYTITITNGFAGSERQISDTAYSCDVSADGATIRYAANYNRDQNTVELFSYEGGQSASLATNVGSSSFTFDRTAEDTVYATDYNVETRSGNLFGVTHNGKTRTIQENVNAYGLKDNGETIFFKNLNMENNHFDLYSAKAQSTKIKQLDSGVSKVLIY